MKRQAPTVRNVRFKVSTRLLDHLGLNMYSSVPKAVSELIVNGYDADATLVTVTSSSSAIVIEDNGAGMAGDSIDEQFLVLASGHKRRTGKTPIFRRDPIGAKGIGKLAGLGIARRIEVETWQAGTLSTFAIDRDEMERAERSAAGEAMLDQAHMQLRTRRTEELGSGTRVILTKLRPEARFVAARVREHLAQELPLSDRFRVIVDSHELRKDEIKGRRISINHLDPVCGLIQGHIVVANSAVQSAGVITTVRGRAVGGPSFFGLTLSNRRYHSTDRIAGQVEVAGLDPDDGTPTAIKTDREGFITSHPRYEAYAIFMRGEIEAIAKDLEARAEAESEARRRAKLTDAVTKAAEIVNAFNERERRLFQVTGRATHVQGEIDQASDILVPRSMLDIEDKGGTRPSEPGKPVPNEPTVIPVFFGAGRLRFRSAVFEVLINPLGVDAAECELYLDRGQLVVNSDHPTYEEAERGGWTEAVVLRAVVTRLACHEASTADEAYGLIDQILRFAAAFSKRKSTGDLAEAV